MNNIKVELSNVNQATIRHENEMTVFDVTLNSGAKGEVYLSPSGASVIYFEDETEFTSCLASVSDEVMELLDSY